MDKLDKLNALLGLLQNDTITPKELEQFLVMVLDVIKQSKDGFEQASAERLQAINQTLEEIQQNHSEVLSKVDGKNTELLATFKQSVSEVKRLVEEVKAIEVKNGEDGKDADEERVITEVTKNLTKLIPTPEPETGEGIVEKINQLPESTEFQIDASHIKNLPEAKGSGRGGSRALRWLTDITNAHSATDGQVLTANGDKTFSFENPSGGPGSVDWGDIGGTLSDQTDLQTALDAKFTLPSLTAGSVLFSNGTTIAQDNANLFWDDTNNRLGIGTTAPQQKLDVYGGATGSASAQIRSADNYAELILQGGSSQNFITSDDQLSLYVNGASRLSIKTDGNVVVPANVGIGTTSPTAKFHIVDAAFNLKASAATGLQVITSGVNSWTNLGTDGVSNILSWYNSGNVALGVFDKNGYVGIGTTNPLHLLTVGDGTTGTRIFSNSSNPYAFRAGGGGAGAVHFGATNSATPDGVFSNNAGTEIFRFTNGGNVGIGTTSPATQLHLHGPAGATTLGITITNDTDAANIFFRKKSGVNNKLELGSANQDVGIFANNIERVSILAGTGNVGIGTTSPDYKLDVDGAFGFRQQTSDPADPDSGAAVLWMAEGTGTGDAGDILMKINVGGTVKTITIVDYSAA